VLATYRAPLTSLHHLAVMIEAGPSFCTAYNLNGASPSSHGLTAGVRAWKLRIAPQVRCLRWAHDSAKAFPLTVSDQGQFLAQLFIARVCWSSAETQVYRQAGEHFGLLVRWLKTSADSTLWNCGLARISQRHPTMAGVDPFRPEGSFHYAAAASLANVSR
jgi:hypothetical protein